MAWGLSVLQRLAMHVADIRGSWSSSGLSPVLNEFRLSTRAINLLIKNPSVLATNLDVDGCRPERGLD